MPSDASRLVALLLDYARREKDAARREGELRAENLYLREALSVALGLMHEQAKTIERARTYNREQREAIRALMGTEPLAGRERAA